MSTIKRYRVIKYFQWGRLSLEKGQIVEISPTEWGELVTLYGDASKQQPIGSGAAESMVQLGKLVEE